MTLSKDLSKDLPQLAIAIQENLNVASKSMLKAGGLLNKCRSLFDSKKDFVAWVKSELNLGTSYAYQLMKADDNFGSLPWAYKVSLSVLDGLDKADSETVEQVGLAVDSGQKVTRAKVNDMISSKAGGAKKVLHKSNSSTELGNLRSQLATAHAEVAQLTAQVEALKITVKAFTL